MHCVPGYQARTLSRTVTAGLVARGFLTAVPGRFGVRESFVRRTPDVGKACVVTNS
jgi:hypothetical protein